MGFLLFLGFVICGILGIFSLVAGIEDKVKRWILIGVLLCVVSLSCLHVAYYANNQFDKQPWSRTDPYVTHTIVALQDGNEVNGSFSGKRYGISVYINEEFMYVYGYKTYNGGMKIQKVSEKYATVFFDDNIAPCAKWYKETKKFWWLEDTKYTCDIFIPTGSLQTEIVIDMQ